MGADDYVLKPFNPRELLARIKTVLRRTGSEARTRTPARQFQFASWTLSTVTRNLTHSDGRVVSLRATQYRILLKLLSQCGVLSRFELLNRAPNRAAESPGRMVDVCISRLRQLLRDDAREPTIIKTVHREGYLIAVDVYSN